MGWNKVAVVGVGMIKFGELFEKSYEALLQEAYLAAIASVDKGFDPKEIQAGWLGTCLGSAMGLEIPGGASLAATVGLVEIPVTRVENGCPTGSDTFRNACLGVASGVYDVALAIGVEKMRDKPTEESLLSIAAQGHPVLSRGGIAPSLFAPQATRHMHEFGTTKEQMALVAVKNHHNGCLDPYAHFQTEITVEQVLNSPPVSYPLQLLDCCPQTDGAAAAILCRADWAHRYTDRPVYVAGFGMGSDYLYLTEKERATEFAATRRAAKQAYAMAGISPQDIDVAEVHDCFTITEILNYEDLGFCEKGQGGRFIEEGRSQLSELGGSLPVNPSGGLLAKGHPLAATGLAQIAELYWHLREDDSVSNRQARLRKGYALQHNVGGFGIATSVVTILTNQAQ
ncbi:MAG: thiolase C-terminal domain-containing protein [Thermodesulfobacteriota bacterium]